RLRVSAARTARTVLSESAPSAPAAGSLQSMMSAPPPTARRASATLVTLARNRVWRRAGLVNSWALVGSAIAEDAGLLGHALRPVASFLGREAHGFVRDDSRTAPRETQDAGAQRDRLRAVMGNEQNRRRPPLPQRGQKLAQALCGGVVEGDERLVH